MKIAELFNVSGKVAIVTGGSRGIGEMIAAGFLANGVKVYITARKEAALIEKAEELSAKFSGECIPVPCDLSTMDGMSDFVKFIESKEEYIDFLINNVNGKSIIFLCKSGLRSTKAVNLLSKYDIQSLSLDGGIDSWVNLQSL